MRKVEPGPQHCLVVLFLAQRGVEVRGHPGRRRPRRHPTLSVQALTVSNANANIGPLALMTDGIFDGLHLAQLTERVDGLLLFT